MDNYKYYFCLLMPYENAHITEYDKLSDLLKSEDFYIHNHHYWFIIKGVVIDV